MVTNESKTAPGIDQPLTIKNCKPNTKISNKEVQEVHCNFQISECQESLQELHEIVKFTYKIQEQGTNTFLNNEQLRHRAQTNKRQLGQIG